MTSLKPFLYIGVQSPTPPFWRKGVRLENCKYHYVDEQTLVNRLKSKDQRNYAFDMLVKTYQQPLYYHVRKIVLSHDDADDVIQNTFIKAWKAIEGFRGDAKLKTWLYRIATNEALTHVKKQKRRAYSDLEDIQNELTHSGSGQPGPDGEEIQRKLAAAMNTLPEKQKLVFTLKYFDEMKYDEIVEVLGGSVGSLKASFHHAVKKIEKYLTTN